MVGAKPGRGQVLWRALALVGVLALVVFRASGQTPAAQPVEAYHLRADTQEWVENVLWRGQGNVQVVYQDIKIQCDELELKLVSGDLDARGHVVLDQGPTRLAAERLLYNLRSKTGTFLEASGKIAPEYFISGATITKLDDTHYRLEDATFTTCEQLVRPPWQFRARKVLVEEEGYGRFWGTTLRVKGAPVFYLPYLLWPVKRERAFGLLVPTVGFSQRRGFYLGNSLFIPIGRSYDTTATLDLYSKGAVGVGSEWRWVPKPASAGEILLYAIRDPKEGVWQWRVRGKHKQDDFHGFRLLAEIDDLSDINFFQEFEHSFDQSTQRSLYSYLYLTRPWGPGSLNLRADYRRTFFGGPVGGVTVPQSETVLAQAPEAELRVRPTRVDHSLLYWSLISSVNLFDVDKGSGLAATYARADLYPSLSYTLPGPPWLTVTPRLGGRATYYTEQYGTDTSHRTVFVNQALLRDYFEGGVDLVGPSLSRVFEFALGPYQRFKHLIEPRLQYTYTSDPGVDPNEVPPFDEVDSLLVRNAVTVSLANRLFGRAKSSSSATELASFEVDQQYSFTQPLNQGVLVSGGQLFTSQRGPLNASLRISPEPGATLDFKAGYDTLFRGLSSTSVSATVGQGGVFSGLTWYSSYSPQTGAPLSSQVQTTLQFRKAGFPLRFSLQVGYDLQRGQLQSDRLQVYYEGSCWGLDFEYRDLRTAVYPARDYRIGIDFKGLGRMLDIRGGLGQPSP